jgi:hypothetical protein
MCIIAALLNPGKFMIPPRHLSDYNQIINIVLILILIILLFYRNVSKTTQHQSDSDDESNNCYFWKHSFMRKQLLTTKISDRQSQINLIKTNSNLKLFYRDSSFNKNKTDSWLPFCHFQLNFLIVSYYYQTIFQMMIQLGSDSWMSGAGLPVSRLFEEKPARTVWHNSKQPL